MSKVKILVVEDDNLLRNLLLESINLEGHDVSIAESAERAEELFAANKFDILLTDVNLPGKSGLDLLLSATQNNPQIYSIVITGFGTIDTAVQAMKLGATDFLCKPIALNDLLSAVRVAVGRVQNPGIVPTKTSPLPNTAIIAESPEMLKLLEEIKTVAPYKLNALITGETGTGKELIARAIHEFSPRNKNKFVALNCAAIPENLLEDELFGHVKGAFTGAQTDRSGRFEQASEGTLFLDEIGDMNLSLQAKLLRVLQESEFERLGSSKTIKVDVRVVAATSANLDKKIADGSFRADLYHRLNVVHLQIPALRDRTGDILPVANGLLQRFCESSGLPPKTLSAETEKTLLAYDFPGNVRQLRNCMERAAVFSGIKREIDSEHLPEEVKKQITTTNSFANMFSRQIPDEGIDFSVVVSNVERELLLQTLDKTGGNKMQAAKLLNMKRTTLVEKIKRLEIEDSANSATDDSTD